LQYTEGPLSIAKWAELVTVHVLPGPAIVTSLKQAAERTINDYNTTVQTEIVAGPARSEPPTPTEEYAGSSSMQQSLKARESDSSTHSAELEKLQMTQIRKHSIVSISTTISTRSEPMSPGPAASSFAMQPRARTESIEDAYARLGSIPYQRAALLLAQMSSAGNLLTESYTQQCLQIGRQSPDFVLGFISQRSLNVKADDNFITFTPGVKLLEPGADVGDGHGQQYRTPTQVIGKDGADVVIVGRGILSAENRVAEAEMYRKAAWQAYELRVEA
jgi:uridine monophosphate synthetase